MNDAESLKRALAEKGRLSEEKISRRPASYVMSPARMGAAFPNALSFSRSAMNEFVRRRWKVERVRIELDSAGEGEALYRIDAGKWIFHFFVLSRQLTEAQQLDRNFATRWDATAALCQGSWSSEREERLRREIPKQINGWTDYDTLVLSRGNRSGRLFEHVVESLVQGKQPDPKRLSQVGYILRTTGFMANGLAGTRPFNGYEADHPLRRPYHAQMCAAFLFREFVFDLAETMAAARSDSAALLSPQYKRYLGLGNSAATGMVRYLLNHPHQINQWCSNWETAFALAKERQLKTDGAGFRSLERLLEKAILYFRQDGRPATGTFADALTISNELSLILDYVRSATMRGNAGPLLVSELCEWTASHTSYETVEILHAISLELFPDIVERFLNQFGTEERMEINPAMTSRELKLLLRSIYGWAFEWDMASSSHERFFWFHSIKAPEDARRGYRHVLSTLEHENFSETIRQVQKLAAYIERFPQSRSAAEIAATAPEFRQIIARVQSLANCEYAEMRDNPLDQRFIPYPSIRFVLAFFGMDKFESAPPKLVRGALLQGAPTAEDVAAGRKGDWPFPLFPKEERDTGRARPRVVSHERVHELIELASTAKLGEDFGDEILVSEAEYIKRAKTALQARGAPLGLAADGAKAFAFQEVFTRGSLSRLLEQLQNHSVEPATRITVKHADKEIDLINAQGGSAALVAAPAFDLACAGAARSPDNVGVVFVMNGSGSSLPEHAAYRAAKRGFLVGVAEWPIAFPGSGSLMSAGSNGETPWLLRTQIASNFESDLKGWFETVLDVAHAAKIIDKLSRQLPREVQGTFSIYVCVKAQKESPLASVLPMLLKHFRSPTRCWDSRDVMQRLNESRFCGLRIKRSDWLQLLHFSCELLLSEANELQLREPGFDATKQF